MWVDNCVDIKVSHLLIACLRCTTKLLGNNDTLLELKVTVYRPQVRKLQIDQNSVFKRQHNLGGQFDQLIIHFNLPSGACGCHPL